MQEIGKFLVLTGIVVTAIGGLFLFSDRIPWIGRLPGDLFIQRKNFAFYFPVATSILLSIIISLILWLAGRR
jgi:hypothetical protein